MGIGIDEEDIGRGLHHALGHGHGLGRRGRLVEQRGAGELEPGHVDDHLLEIEQRLEPSLAHLGLVGRIGRVPARIFQHVAQDHLWRDGAVVAHADHRAIDLVALGHGAEIGERGALGHRRLHLQSPLRPDSVRNHLGDEVLQRCGTHRAQHLARLGFGRPDMPRNEIGPGLKLGQRRSGGHLQIPLSGGVARCVKALTHPATNLS